MGGCQRMGILIIPWPMPPQRHRHAVWRFAADNGFQSFPFAPI
jgi:hypothetical protein